MRTTIELGLKVIATLIALFGVGKYFFDLSLDRQLSAKAAALERINRLSAGDVDAARNILFQFWLENAQVVTLLREQSVTERAYTNFIITAFDGAENRLDLIQSIYSLSQHYDDVFFCLDSSLCDSGMMLEYYCPRVSVTYRAYGPIIQTLRDQSGYSSFGAGIQALSELCALRRD